jgi:glycosyltransferase involved in cell wall biosynthesis
MDDPPLVSVIIIFFNTEAFIEEAIESVIGQTYTSWEILLIDDGSTDTSTQIAQRYVAQYPKQIHYFEHPNHENRGMSASRNLGLCHARGEYIALLDADDVWLPYKLERQVAILTSQPEAAMVYGETEYWYSWTRNPEDSSRDYVQHHGIEVNTLYKPPVLLSLFLRGKAAVPCTCSILVRCEALEHIGGFEESFRGMYEDQVFYAKVCLTEPIFVSDEYLDRYRQHPDSNCSVAAKTGYAQSARLYFLNWLATYISELGVEDHELWQALRRELWFHSQPTLPKSALNILRWIKKWLLRLEERSLPPLIRGWLWLN